MEKSLIDIRNDFKEKHKKGSFKEFVSINGGYDGIIKKFKSVAGVLNEMKKANYSRSYRSEIKKELKERGY